MEKKLCLKMLLLSVYFGCTLSDFKEETTEDIVERLLSIPNTDKVLNSVLGRLERNRQARLAAGLLEEEDCDEPIEILPEYTESLYESRNFALRQIGAQKHYPICHIERSIQRLNTNEYEYKPAYYEEVKCVSFYSDDSSSNEICTSLGFSCVQWNKTIHLTRRRYSSDCWETKTLVIPAGCECMWPIHKLGDMKLHI